MDAETEKMDIPQLLEGYATVVKAYEAQREQVDRQLGEADAVITVFGRVSVRELELAKKLRIIAVAAAGYDSVDVKAATARRVLVTRAGTATVDGVAEHAIGLMISLSKRINVGAEEVRKGNWAYRNTQEACGTQLFGKVVGTVGFGKVGKTLAKKAVGMGMRVLAVDPYVSPEQIRKEGFEPASLEQALRTSDYLCLTGALTKETYHIIGAKEISMMRGSSYLINVARGGMVDEAALHKALTEGRISGAGLDVLETEPMTNSPLFQLRNCIVTPHTAGLTRERYQDCGRVAVGEVKRVLGGSQPTRENVINPEILPPGA